MSITLRSLAEYTTVGNKSGLWDLFTEYMQIVVEGTSSQGEEDTRSLLIDRDSLDFGDGITIQIGGRANQTVGIVRAAEDSSNVIINSQGAVLTRIEFFEVMAAAAGPKGDPGPVGPAGAKGDPGVGVPVGGAAGMALVKKSDTDFDTEWKTIAAGTLDGSTAGQLIVERYAPGAPDLVKEKAAGRVDAYLAKSYDKINMGRSAPPGVLVKSGASSILWLWRVPEAVAL